MRCLKIAFRPSLHPLFQSFYLPMVSDLFVKMGCITLYMCPKVLMLNKCMKFQLMILIKFYFKVKLFNQGEDTDQGVTRLA